MINEEVLILAFGAGLGPRWEAVPIRSRHNPEIICAALNARNSSIQDVPMELVRNHRENGHIRADGCVCFDDHDVWFRQAFETGTLK